MNKAVRWVLIGICVAIFLASACFLGKYLTETLKAVNQFDELTQIRDQVIVDVPPEWLEPAPTEPAATDPTENTEPEEELPPQILPEYAQLYEMNNDMVGWITIEGTKIDYPVMQRKEEKDYYLYRDFYGEDNKHGCIYVREKCDVFAPSDNVVIYGHRMKDGTMFRSLLQYDNRSFYNNHTTIIFNTLYERHTYEIVAVFKTTATKKGFQFHMFDDAASEKEFNDFVAKCKELSLYDTGVDAVYGDKLITLATCEYSQNEGRLVVVAKRIN